jgi:hypothetical protein
MQGDLFIPESWMGVTIGGGDSTCGNGDYKRQTKSSLVHDSTRKATS